MATPGMIEALKNLLSDYCPVGDPFYHDLISWFVVHTHGVPLLKHPSHLSVTGPDDYADTQVGKIIEATSRNPSLTTFSDLSLRSGSNQKDIGTMIIYVEKKLRHSEEYERLCQLLRNGYLEKDQKISVVVIGNGGFIDRKIINRTIPLYVPPFTNYVPGFFYSKVEGKVKEAKDLIEEFWKNDLSDVQKCYDKFPRPDWLKNQHEQLWLPILAPSKAYSDRLGQPTHFEQMVALAKKIVTSRRMEESAIPLEQKVLEATLTFIEMNAHAILKNPDGIEFYSGPDLCEFIRKMIDLPKLRKEKISAILNDHDGVVEGTWRPRIEVIDEKASTKGKQVKKITQPTCYLFNKERLAESLRNYRQSG